MNVSNNIDEMKITISFNNRKVYKNVVEQIRDIFENTKDI